MTDSFAPADFYLYSCTGCDTRTLLDHNGGPLNGCSCNRDAGNLMASLEQIRVTPLDARESYALSGITNKDKEAA